MGQTLTPAYRGVMLASKPIVKAWGRMDVSGLDALPETGPVLLAGNHDSYWDPIAIGMAAMPVRQIHALAKSTLWKPVIGKVLDGMGQIPIQRGKGDAHAMDRAIQALREGVCIGVFPEGTRSLGRELRPRSGIGRLAQAVPEAEIVLCTVTGTADIFGFPKRPDISVRFFRPSGGGLQEGEELADFAARLVNECRNGAPVAVPARSRKAKRVAAEV